MRAADDEEGFTSCCGTGTTSAVDDGSEYCECCYARITTYLDPTQAPITLNLDF